MGALQSLRQDRNGDKTLQSPPPPKTIANCFEKATENITKFSGCFLGKTHPQSPVIRQKCRRQAQANRWFSSGCPL
jgi:hypothetical protein